MARDWQLYAQDILDCIAELEEITREVASLENLRQSRRDLHTMERCFEIIGEAAKHLPQQSKDSQGQIPWRNIIGLRDVIAHGYFTVSPETLWSTAVSDLDALKRAIEAIIRESGESQK